MFLYAAVHLINFITSVERKGRRTSKGMQGSGEMKSLTGLKEYLKPL